MSRNSLQSHELPFSNITDFQLQQEYLSPRERVESFMHDKGIRSLNEINQSADHECFTQNIQTCRYYDEQDFNRIHDINSARTLKIFALNIRSLPKHRGALLAYLSNMAPFDILVFTEIGRKNLTLVQGIFPDHEVYFDIPEKYPRGGVGIYLSHDISNIHKQENHGLKCQHGCNKCMVESLIINFSFSGQDYTLCAIYRHPNGNVSHFTNSMTKLFDSLDSKRSQIWIGDINIDLIKYKETNNLEYFTNLMSYGYVPLITLPTRVTDHTATCIDHIFVKPAKNITLTPGVLYADLSDHLPVFACFHHRVPNNTNRPKIRIYGEKNSINFINNVEKIDWNIAFIDDPDSDWCSLYITELEKQFNYNFPLRTLSRKRQRDKPWITPGLKISIRHKNRLYRKSIQKPSPSIYSRYLTYKYIVDKCIKEAEANHHKSVFENHSASAKRTWHYLSNMIGQRSSKSSQIAKIRVNNKDLFASEDISNAFNDYFCSIGKELSDKLPHRKNAFINYLQNKIVNSFYLRPIIKEDLIKIIKSLSANKAPGPDNIGAKLLKLKPDLFATPLVQIFNRSIESGIYPTKLKVAKVVTIYKKGLQSFTGNYRPISLLSCFNKIFEKAIHKQLISFLERYKLLYIFQFGFRKLHSTTLALIEITDKIKYHLDKGEYVVGLYLDLTKAFDTVDHEILLEKMTYYGIRGHANNFFRSYLTDRQQYCHVNNTSSSLRYQRYGVPQGSVLGPLLFLLYINDIYNAIDTGAIRLFADDTSLFVHDKDLNTAISNVSINIRKLQDWFISNKLTLNETKTYFSIYHTKNKPIPNNLNSINVEGFIVHRVKSVKYIGLTIDEGLLWKDHVDTIINNVVKYFGIFNNIKQYISQKLARQLYFAFVSSRIRYGIESYGSCSQTNIAKLQTIQNKLLKLLLKLPFRHSTNDLHQKLKILKVNDLYKVCLLNFVHQRNTDNLPAPLSKYFEYTNPARETRRNELNLKLDRFRTELGSTRVQVRAARLWNEMNTYLKTISDIKQFKKELIKNIISDYVDE